MLLLAGAVYLFVAVRNAGEVNGLVISAGGILSLMAVLALISSRGLWRNKAWACWLAMFTDTAGLVIFLWDPIERRVWPDVDEWFFIVLFALAIGFLITLPARKLIQRKKENHRLIESA